MDTNTSPSPDPQRVMPDDYELKIDDQVTKYLELNHKVTFFVITAAIAPLAFSLNFAASNKVLITANIFHFCLLAAASVLALFSAGCTLVALNKDMQIFRLHLRYRYERKVYDQLSQQQKEEWAKINSTAACTRQFSFVFLGVAVALQVLFFIVTLTQKG